LKLPGQLSGFSRQPVAGQPRSGESAEVRSADSEQWQRAAFMGDRFLWVTADELAELGPEVLAVANKYFERTVRPELRPPGARLVSILNFGFPNVTLRDEP
jgi:hypothetical protein